jgi:Ca-activated chloride channel homolog
MALALYQPLFWGALIILILSFLFLAYRLRLRWLPAFFLRTLFIGLILFSIYSPRGEFFSRPLPQRQVLLLDLSDSISMTTRQNYMDLARGWQSLDINRILIAFGSNVETILSKEETWPVIDGRGSNLSGALAKAGEYLGSTPGQIIIASDGLVPEEMEIDRIILELHALGHQVDVIKLDAAVDLQDISVGELLAPLNLWERTPFTAIFPVFAPTSGDVTLRFYMDGALYSEQVEHVSRGENYYLFSAETHVKEVMTLEASATWDRDPRPENNRSFTVLQVFDSPKALFVTQTEDSVIGLIDSLAEAGIKTAIVSPDALPTDLRFLGEYQVVFIHNLLAKDMSFEQMLALKIFVSEMGRGLVFLGGLNSYTLGGYQDTILESILPIKLEPPPREQRPPSTFVIVMDSSSSMAIASEVRPIELAREAAMRAVEILTPDDYVGVMSFSHIPFWDVPVARVGEGLTLRRALDSVSQIQASGGTNMMAALQLALEDLGKNNLTGSRHLLLLSDGRSSDGSPEFFTGIAIEAQDMGISISTIALGEKSDKELMQQIAELSGGRYHLAIDPNELPEIMISESRAARSENIQTGETALVPGDPSHPVLSGFSPIEIPHLLGYNALSSKENEGSEDILISTTFGDPILSSRQYGLGRVIAWMGDGGELWSREWPEWDKLGMFWAQVVRYALPNPALDPAQIEIQATDTALKIKAHINNQEGLPLNFIDPEFSYADQENTVHSFLLNQAAPGFYNLDIPLPLAGAYRAVVSYNDGEESRDVPAQFAVNYPSEWRSIPADVGNENLDRWMRTGKGKEVSLETDGEAEKLVLSQVNRSQPWWRLLLAAVILWPLEIAIRRRWLPWTG